VFTTDVWRVGVAKSRISNGVQYASPKWMGLRVSAQVSMSEIDGGKNGTGLSAVYENGGITAIAALDRPVVTTAGNPQPTAWLIGGRYKTGPFTFSLSHNDGDTKSAKKGENAGNTAGFEWAHGAGTVKASYALMSNELTSAKGVVTKSDKVKVLGLGYEYALSKRTTLYTAAVKEDVLDVSGLSAGITHRF
jgi:predicted porin